MKFEQVPIFFDKKIYKVLIIFGFLVSLGIGHYAENNHLLEIVSLLLALLTIGLFPFTGIIRNSIVVRVLLFFSLKISGGHPPFVLKRNKGGDKYLDAMDYILVTGLEYIMTIFGLVFFVLVLALWIGQTLGVVPSYTN